LLLPGSPARAADLRPFALEDIAGLRKISEVRVSPDGKGAVLAVRSANLATNRFETDLWIVPLDGSGPERQVTFRAGPDSSPRWSPDGGQIGFLSKRGDLTQVWSLPMGAGEARPLISHSESIAAFEWAPDGRHMLLIAPASDTEQQARKKKDKDDSYLLGRQWRNHQLWLASLEDGRIEPLTDASAHVLSAVWSPDGARVAFVSRPTPEDDSAEESRARILEAASRRARDVPGGERAQNLAWSPNGRALAFTRPFDARGVSREDLFVWTLDGGAARNLSSGLDRDVEAVRWSVGGAALDILYARGALSAVAHHDLASGRIETLWAPGHTVEILERAGDGWLYAPGDRPADLWVAGVRGEGARRLTRLNAAADGKALARVEVVRWKGESGEVEGVLSKPHDYDPGRRYPLILNPHGGPRGRSGAEFDAQTSYFTARGFVVLQPNFRGSTGYGDAFTRGNVADWGDGPLHDVMAGVDALIRKGVVDPKRLFIYGWSYGGYLTDWAITHTDRFRAAVSGAGVADLRMQYSLSDARRWRFDYFTGSPFTGNWPLYEKQSPITYIRQARTPTLFLHGEQDVRCPLPQGLMMHRGVVDNGVESQIVIYPREDHLFAEPRHILDKARRIADWFIQHDPAAAPQP
jgi:dipeptidyl aminopeptidase/acylaminoacyl peptidase